jgi:hypothetical protein
LTLIVSVVVAAPIVLANLTRDDPPYDLIVHNGAITNVASLWAAATPSYGWPLIWRWRNRQLWYGASTDLDQNYNVARLTGNLPMWLAMVGAPTVACEWLLRRYRPRLRWSLRTMLAAVGLLAALCGWGAALRHRAKVQDPILSEAASSRTGYYLHLERWGPKWLDLVGAERYRRQIVGADVTCSSQGDVEFLNRLRRLSNLRYLHLKREQARFITQRGVQEAPGLAAVLARMTQLSTLRIDDRSYGEEALISAECLAAVGMLDQLVELHLGGGLDTSGLAYLAGLSNLKSLSLQLDWVLDEEEPAEVKDDDGMDEADAEKEVKDEPELDAPENDRSVLLVEQLPTLPLLEALDLGGDQFLGGNQLHFLAALPRLKSLNVSGIQLTGAGRAALALLTSLEELAVNDNMASPAGLRGLIALKRLKRLHVLRYTAVTEERLAQLTLQDSREELKKANNGMLVSASDVLHTRALLRAEIGEAGRVDNSDRLTTVALDHGDAIFALESEVDDFRRALDALRKANPGIIIDSDHKWFEQDRGAKRRVPAMFPFGEL